MRAVQYINTYLFCASDLARVPRVRCIGAPAAVNRQHRADSGVAAGTFRTFTDNQTLTVCNNEVYVGSDTPGELCVLASTILTGNVPERCVATSTTRLPLSRLPRRASACT